ncbi:SNF2-related protein, partial [Acidaminococcus fermentans]|uniref:DEAD/DEAH box helicase n=1 Tax=Acidaminococcus fermentans TaxID=905 RepID=UPI002431DB7F
MVPASLLGNWSRELDRFTPLSYTVLHGRTAKKLEEVLETSHTFLTLTTYALVPRVAGLQKIPWDGVILDEAQAIKNPGTRQTLQIKGLKARHRLAMTGTPVENDLSNLWSLFDFLDPGLLGSRKEFSTYATGLVKSGNYEPLRAALSPFILRRLKTDKSIISDLPEKIEKNEYISLSPCQVALYRSEVSHFRTLLQENAEVG